MQILNLDNPFHAPIYFIEQCDSTQNVARNILAEKPITGTVITTAYQNKGRGRGANRQWKSEAGESLLFTIMFQYKNITDFPKAFTIRIGLAVAEAISQFAPELEKHITVKWPNDVMIGSRKVCGILAENDGKYILTGIGINVNQQEFPEEICKKAVSVWQAMSEEKKSIAPFLESHHLLEKILPCLQTFLSSSMDNEWNAILQKILYKRGEAVSFIPGQADSKEKILGTLEGVAAEGELLIKIGTEIKSYITGELAYEKSV
jgi:BirA family biotin operon repressor/biotin-[acetyl-CoA-carboxylase] ligase